MPVILWSARSRVGSIANAVPPCGRSREASSSAWEGQGLLDMYFLLATMVMGSWSCLYEKWGRALESYDWRSLQLADWATARADSPHGRRPCLSCHASADHGWPWRPKAKILEDNRLYYLCRCVSWGAPLNWFHSLVLYMIPVILA